ncbi:sensor histidine kinase [Ammoniphilus sp. CFH 90114]|uniref:sensor histidine kinase n=1 Tax=Ammoniphilus sp. CFH 90114 TaxID=2493665 RepID=UPI00100FA685|nr:sensor histidine kinase [Ammoniphilus sp. CFH 90114]RXT04492.1 histidine kinase [Ammoniphilus sp. CFH 90114]
MTTTNALDFTRLDSVLKKTIHAVEGSKEQIFDIAESARIESEEIRDELESIKREVREIVDQTDELEHKFKSSRQRLVEVSRNFQRYGEEDIKKSYELASQIQVALSLSREKEANLRNRRDELERRLKGLAETLEKADNLMTQISVVLGFLTGDLGNLTSAMETAQQRQMLALQVIQAQEEERKRVARDIHDGPAQSMANIVIRSEIADRILAQGRVDDARAELKELKVTVRNTLAEVRKIIFDLRPMALDDLGIVPTLRKYVEDFGQRHQIASELVTLGTDERLPTTVEVVIFRLIQEALNNAAKHSKASQIQVKLEFLKDQVTVLVKDNGVGFDSLEKTEQPQFGIMGMKERINLLDGKLDLQSAKGQGTRIVFTIPIER